MRGVEQIPWLYDAMCTVMEWTGLSRWRAWLVKGAKGRTLEVGCGTGRNLPRYEPSLAVIALEPDADALKKAKLRTPNALLVRGSAEALPFRDGAFDTVVSSLVFCSVPKPELGLKEIGRVLTTDGQLRMLEHVRHDSKPIGWKPYSQRNADQLTRQGTEPGHLRTRARTRRRAERRRRPG
jgi:ubiquinone/menaquinone biosynthesis C-methylase UbiE